MPLGSNFSENSRYAVALFSRLSLIVALVCLSRAPSDAQYVELNGGVTDPQARPVPGALIHLQRGRVEVSRVKSDEAGLFAFHDITPGDYTVRAEAHGFADVSKDVSVPTGQQESADLQFGRIAEQRETMVITAKSLAPAIDLRNSEVFDRTLFTRDDQALQQLNAGINAGQHEGGGKSLEIRRFGFNLDHGGVNGGLKILVDDVQQNQGTQGHGQGTSGR